MVAIKCQRLTVSIQQHLRQQFLPAVRTVTVGNLWWLLANIGFFKAGYWRCWCLEEQGLGVSSSVCAKPEHAGETCLFLLVFTQKWEILGRRYLIHNLNLIFIFVTYAGQTLPKVHWNNIFFQRNLRQMKVVLFPCRSWQSVTQLLSSTKGWAKSGCSLFLYCSLLFPFPVPYSKCAIIPINSQQQTCFLACKTSRFQHATIPYCNRNKYTFFFLAQQGTNVHPHMSTSQQTRRLIWDVEEKDIQPLILPLPSCSPASQESLQLSLAGKSVSV